MNGTAAKLAELNLQAFIEVRNALDECDPDIRDVVLDMLDIYNDDDATADEKQRAMHTMVEGIFSSLAADTINMERKASKTDSALETATQLDYQEETFANRLREAMTSKRLTQEGLAKRIGIGQSAIANMLSRTCRPQKKTVARLAEALGLSPEDLWPSR